MASDKALLLREFVRSGAGLRVDEARALFAAMLAGDVSPVELAEAFAAWPGGRATLATTLGFMRALDAHAARLAAPPEGPRPVVLPSYHGTRLQPNLTALLAMLLRRYEAPVVVHGIGAREHGDAAQGDPSESCVSTVGVLWELGVEPAASLADARARLAHDKIVFVPLEVLAPGHARLLSLRPQGPPPAMGRTLAKLLDPFGGGGYRVIGAQSPDELAGLREFLVDSHADALLFRGAEGEPFADPRYDSRLEHLAAGVATLCAESEGNDGHRAPPLPAAGDAPATAAWITSVLAGSEPVPPAIVAQLGCCLIGARRHGVAA